MLCVFHSKQTHLTSCNTYKYELSFSAEKYASHWCGMLMASDGPFADCHKTVAPEDYHQVKFQTTVM